MTASLKAIVTGGASGTVAATVAKLTEHGVRVAALDVNVVGLVRVTRAVLPALRRSRSAGSGAARRRGRPRRRPRRPQLPPAARAPHTA